MAHGLVPPNAMSGVPTRPSEQHIFQLALKVTF